VTGARSAHRLKAGVCDAGPQPVPSRHPNAGLIDPLWVSEDCTGLTALYAALNGIRFALAHQHRFTVSEVHTLMTAGFRFFEGRLSPNRCVMNGIRVQLWPGLVAAMCEATSQRTGRRVLLERIHIGSRHDRMEVFNALEDAIARFRVPLILLRGGTYTVVTGFTRASILLFDSRGYSWISKRSCGVPGDQPEARYMLCPSALVALNV
jgi:hypothetical protein